MSKMNINLSINDSYEFPDRRMEDEYVITGLTINNRTYVEIKQHCKKHKVSDSKVRGLIKNVEHARCNEFFIKINNKIYVNPSIAMLSDENFSKMNTLKGNWEAFLRGHEWDYFGCVNFEWCLQQSTVKERMNTFFDKLSKKYKTAAIRLFYVCEKNPDRDGYHTHFLLWTDIANKAEVKKFTENHFRGNGAKQFANTKIEKYEPNEGGVGYCLKQMHLNPDGYDYLYKNKS